MANEIVKSSLFAELSKLENGSDYMEYINNLEEDVKLLTNERDSLEDKVSCLEDDIISLEDERDNINDKLEETEKTQIVVDDIIKDFYFYGSQKYKTKNDILFALEYGV